MCSIREIHDLQLIYRYAKKMKLKSCVSLCNGMCDIIKHYNDRGDVNMTKEEKKVEQEVKRCFVMMPFSTPEGYEKDHFIKIYDQIIKPAVTDAGFEPVRVDENNLSTSIVSKIFDGLINCEMAICDLSSRNPNVLYELGIRQAYNKPVVLIKDEKTDFIFDVSGITTIEYQSMRLYEHVMYAKKNIKDAIIENSKSSNKMVDIIRATSAIVTNSNEMTNEDKNTIMIKSLSSEIKELKRILLNNLHYRSQKLELLNNESDKYYNRFKKELNYIFEGIYHERSFDFAKYDMYMLKLESLRNRLFNSSNLDKNMLIEIEKDINSIISILDKKIEFVKEERL